MKETCFHIFYARKLLLLWFFTYLFQYTKFLFICNLNSRESLPIENKKRENIALTQHCENFEERNNLNLVLFIS